MSIGTSHIFRTRAVVVWPAGCLLLRGYDALDAGGCQVGGYGADHGEGKGKGKIPWNLSFPNDINAYPGLLDQVDGLDGG